MPDRLKASHALAGLDIGTIIHVKWHESDIRGTLTAVTHTTAGSVVQVESNGTTWQVPLTANDLVVVGAEESDDWWGRQPPDYDDDPPLDDDTGWYPLPGEVPF